VVQNQTVKLKNMKKNLLLALAFAGLATSLQANTVVFDSTVWGTSGDLGVSSQTFNSGGVSLNISTTSSGAGGPASSAHLYAKNGGGDETGLGVIPAPEFEINPDTGLTILVPSGGLLSIFLGSVQSGEAATVFWGTTFGATTFGFPLVTSNGSVNVSSVPAGDYITIYGSGIGGQNVLLDTVVANGPSVPDGGTTLAMLGSALTVLGLARRKLVA
jgi:hypothetical protein